VTRPHPVLLALLAGAGLLAAPAGAADGDRLTRLTSAPGGPDGPSSAPSITPGGRYVAFHSSAANLTEDPNGAVRDVFLRDTVAGGVERVSRALDGGGADGASEAPVVTGGGIVVFKSAAANLVAGDANAADDIFLRRPGAQIVRVSLPAAGGEADGPSFEPDVSRDGRFVVFSSRARNLVPGDANGVEDVFVRDTVANTTRLVSQRRGASAAGRSRAPSISADGRWVSFHSTAANLVARDANRLPDVFLADLRTGRIQLVSVSSAERQQNRAVVAPFVQVSDVSRDGRFVAFDSDASNLVPRDLNRDTDVFVRDVRRGRTDLVSLDVTGRQGDNDSYFPTISPDGRYVGFTSFAGLWPGDPRGEDLYLYDRNLRSSTILTARTTGKSRGAEVAPQLLRRVSISDGARAAVFTSTARLAAGDADSYEDVLLRRTSPVDGRIVSGPSGTISDRRPRLRLAATDPAAVFTCRLDGRTFVCGRDTRLPRLSRGRHRLVVRAGAAGIVFDRTPAVRVFRVR
jgi:Tol biopolymer transport system component